MEFIAIQSNGNPIVLDEFQDPADFDAVWDVERNEEIKLQPVRDARNGKLKELDKVVSNALIWGSLTSQEQAELTIYRQALLDLPSQVTDVNNVVYPHSNILDRFTNL